MLTNSDFQPDPKPIVIIAPTPRGYRLGLSIQDSIGAETLWTKDSSINGEFPTLNVRTYSGAIAPVVEACWHEVAQLVFVLTTGAVVRLIAPLLNQKSQDPGVVVIDETGTFIVSLSGGHQGGADALARQCAAILGVTPVITSAAEGQHLPALDCLGSPYGWQQGSGDWTVVATAITQNQPVRVTQTCGSVLWQRSLLQKHLFIFDEFDQPIGNVEGERRKSEVSSQEVEGGSGKAELPQLWISDHLPAESGIPTVCWHPRTLWVGLGCERNTDASLIETSLRQIMQENRLAWGAIAGISTINIKQDEPAFQHLAQQYHWPIRYYTAKELATQSVPTPSNIVAQAVGTPSVSEAAALLAAKAEDKTQQSAVTSQQSAERTRKKMELGRGQTFTPYNSTTHYPPTTTPPLLPHAAKLLVTKQVFKSDQGACTIAIARSDHEYNPRVGHLYLIGSGPGALSQLTAAARTALQRCDVVIGYSLYLELLAPLFHANQVLEPSQITQEVQRAERAVTLAEQGLTVGMVSSGDCGIYGMAGLVLECLVQRQWDGQTPSIDVMPGITALQAIAARVGAPLMHDFCAISLSDLLTPWEVIEKRLEAAAQADFVVALYNPRSKTRLQGIEIALEIMSKWRSPSTPVAIARSLYRNGEFIQCLTLGDVDVTTIDMLTVVLIGNASTFLHKGRMITPRGYNVPPSKLASGVAPF